MTKDLFACLLLAALWLAGCAEPEAAADAETSSASEASEVAVNVRTLEVTTTSLSEYLDVSGPLQPIHATDVSTEETGVVASIRRDKGSSVDSDEVVVELDRALLRAEMTAASAMRELREYNEDRTRQLFEAKQASRQEMLTVEAELADASSREDIARLRFERAAIKAPFAGIVTDRYVEPGELVQAGMRVARIVDPYTLKLVGSVSEQEIAWVRPGAKARVELLGSPEQVDGFVHWVAFEANPTTGKFALEVRVRNSRLKVRPGIVGRARIVKQEHDDAIAIPRDAILLLNGESTVFVARGDRAVARPLTLGADQGLMTIVRSGLSPGEQLVVRGQRDLREGSLISITETASSLDGTSESDPDEVRASAADTPAPVTSEGRTR